MQMRFDQFGAFTCKLDGVQMVDARLLTSLWTLADAFSIVLFGIRVLSAPGRKVLRKLTPHVERLRPIPRGSEFWTMTHWLATEGHNKVMLRGVASAFRHIWLGDSGRLPWSAGTWEDLALYLDGKVLCHSCTHEGQVEVFGERAVFRELGLDGRASSASWLVEGEKLDYAAHEVLLNPVM